MILEFDSWLIIENYYFFTHWDSEELKTSAQVYRAVTKDDVGEREQWVQNCSAPQHPWHKWPRREIFAQF